MAFPTSLDTFVAQALGEVILATDINELQTAITSLQAAVGITGSAVTTAHDYRILDRLGRAGGQTWNGGTAANESAIIEGTSHATGTNSTVDIGPAGKVAALRVFHPSIAQIQLLRSGSYTFGAGGWLSTYCKNTNGTYVASNICDWGLVDGTPGAEQGAMDFGYLHLGVMEAIGINTMLSAGVAATRPYFASGTDLSVDIGLATSRFVNGYFQDLSVKSDSAGALGPTITFDHASASPAVSDVIAKLIFKGRTDSAATATYALINIVAESVANAAKTSAMTFQVYRGNTFESALAISPASAAIFPGVDAIYSSGLAAFRWLNVYTNVLELKDGITAPSTVAGSAFIYVDTADGDLKVKFGDGFVRVIGADS